MNVAALLFDYNARRTDGLNFKPREMVRCCSNWPSSCITDDATLYVPCETHIRETHKQWVVGRLAYWTAEGAGAGWA